MDRCLGGTESNPCTKKPKYTLEWVMEDVDLCAEHFDQEDNAKKLREQIALEIEAQIESLSLQDGLFKSGMIGACTIVRGKNAIL
jgi:hypothetical protein